MVHIPVPILASPRGLELMSGWPRKWTTRKVPVRSLGYAWLDEHGEPSYGEPCLRVRIDDTEVICSVDADDVVEFSERPRDALAVLYLEASTIDRYAGARLFEVLARQSEFADAVRIRGTVVDFFEGYREAGTKSVFSLTAMILVDCGYPVALETEGWQIGDGIQAEGELVLRDMRELRPAGGTNHGRGLPGAGEELIR